MMILQYAQIPAQIIDKEGILIKAKKHNENEKPSLGHLINAQSFQKSLKTKEHKKKKSGFHHIGYEKVFQQNIPKSYDADVVSKGITDGMDNMLTSTINRYKNTSGPARPCDQNVKIKIDQAFNSFDKRSTICGNPGLAQQRSQGNVDQQAKDSREYTFYVHK